jgi:hypothetical protein
VPHGAGGRSIHLFATNMPVLQLSFILWPAPGGQPEIQEHEKNRLDAGPSQVVCSQGQRGLSRGEQRPAEPRAPLDGEQRLTDPSKRIDLGGICSCCTVRSGPAHTLEVVDSGNLKPRLLIFSWWSLHIAREASRASGPVPEGGPGSQNRPGHLGTECDQNIDWKQPAIDSCQVEFRI